MQVNNVNYYQNTPNFQAIKSIQCKGLYKKYPELAQKLIDAFPQCQEAMDFCRKYDTDVIFVAKKSTGCSIESSVNIIFDNPAISKFKKCWNYLTGSQNKVEISAFAEKMSDVEYSLGQATSRLIKYIDPKCGVLKRHVSDADKAIQNELVKQEQKKLEKKLKLATKLAEKNKFEQRQTKLQKSIQDLIGNTVK